MSLPADVAGAPIPRDARIIALIMYSMGITDADPAVLLQLLEFANRYTHDVLQDALVYADHAAARSGAGAGASGAAGALSLEDIQLAIQSRVNYSFTHPPPKDVLVSLAASINSIPLPPISDRVGIRLPPLEHCLTNVNFAIVPNSPPRSRSPSPEVKREAIAAPPAEDGLNGHARARRLTAAQDEDMGMHDGAALPAPDAARSRWQQEDDNYDDEPSHGAAAAPPPPPPAAAAEPPRGTKRALDEDDDYD
ncbi:Transcription initiation factor TFIID subunit 9 [Tilletia horrida]|nr:Transcription initiation factor TFIID subunit 9 [Tilletia horrida]